MNFDISLMVLIGAILAAIVMRSVGVAGAGYLQQDSAIFRWTGSVGFAIAAGVMTKMIVLPSGALQEAPLAARVCGLAVGIAIFFGFGRRLSWGLLGGVLAFFVADQFIVGF